MNLIIKIFNHKVEIHRELSKKQDEQIRKWVKSGKVIEAVKLIRLTTHWGLYECKQYCDLIQFKYGNENKTGEKP